MSMSKEIDEMCWRNLRRKLFFFLVGRSHFKYLRIYTMFNKANDVSPHRPSPGYGRNDCCLTYFNCERLDFVSCSTVLRDRWSRNVMAKGSANDVPFLSEFSSAPFTAEPRRRSETHLCWRHLRRYSFFFYC